MMTDKQRITEILKAYTKKYNISASSVILEEYAEELLANGVIVPPCKVGDWVYSIFVGDTKIARNFIEPNGDRITQIKINRKGYHFKCWWGYFHISDIGKTVFLTKEEAEEKLKEREGK